MTATAICLPRQDSLVVAAYRRLGRGLRFLFRVADEAGELVLEPGPTPDSGVSLSFESGCGVMTFSDCTAILSLFGECPVVLADTGNDPDSWFWGLFQQRLSPQLTGLFGYLRPLADVQQGTFECRVSVALGQSRSVGRLTMPAQTLLALYDAGAWQAIKAPLWEGFAVSIPIVLGHLQLAIEQVRTVRPGDVLLAECSGFSTEGFGSLRVGRLKLDTQMDDGGGRRCLKICSVEESAMDDVLFTSTGVAPIDEPGAAIALDEPIEGLLLEMSVRCGALKLSLGELRQLVPGMVLTVEGYGAGMAGLYYGDRRIGHGQLVEVDGRFGLQLSRISFSQ